MDVKDKELIEVGDILEDSRMGPGVCVVCKVSRHETHIYWLSGKFQNKLDNYRFVFMPKDTSVIKKIR